MSMKDWFVLICKGGLMSVVLWAVVVLLFITFD